MTAATLSMVDNPRTAAVSRRVLKILSGRLSGKAFPLDGRDRLSIGHGLGNDVVLRGAGTRDCAVLGWTAPNGIAMCQSECVARLNQGSRPWSKLPA